MKNLISLKFWYSLVLMLATVSFTACVDDNDDTEAPFLEVTPSTLSFAGEGTQAFDIKTNRTWTATVQDGVDWVTLSPKAGEGSAKVSVSVPAGVNGEAKIDIVLSNKVGELMKETVTVKAGTGVAEKSAIAKLIEGMPAANSTDEEAAVVPLAEQIEFEAVVCGDPDGGNDSYGTLYIMTEGATQPGEALSLYNNKMDMAKLFDLGDKVKITLPKDQVKAYKRYDTPQVTGIVAENIQVISKGNAVNPIVVTPEKIVDYLCMPVTVKDVTAAQNGVWLADKNSHSILSSEFTVAGKPMTVYINKRSSFLGVPYKAATGDLTGIAAVHKQKGQLLPRNLNDVKAFASTEVMITKVTPDKLSFAAGGETKTLEVTVANYNNQKITAAGLSADKFTVTVAGTKITVEAKPNAGTSAISEKLTVSVEGAAKSVEVPVTVAAPAPQGGDQGGQQQGGVLTVTSDDIIAGKTSADALLTGSYGTQNVNDEATWYTWKAAGIDFKGVKLMKAKATDGGGIQIQGNDTDATKQGFIANVTALNNIQTIELVFKDKSTSKYAPNYSLYAGSSVKPVDKDKKGIEPTSTMKEEGGFKVYTHVFDLSAGNYSYFTIMNDKVGVLRLQSIKVTCKK